MRFGSVSARPPNPAKGSYAAHSSRTPLITIMKRLIKTLSFFLFMTVATAQAARPLVEASMDVSSGRPVVTAKTAGDIGLKLLVDSGGFGAIALTPAVLSSASVEFNGYSVEWQDADGRQFSARQFTEDDIRIGATQLGPVGGSEFLGSGLPPGTVGYLGLDILEKFIVKLDYKSGLLSLHEARGRDAFADACGTSSFPATLRNGVVDRKSVV